MAVATGNVPLPPHMNFNFRGIRVGLIGDNAPSKRICFSPAMSQSKALNSLTPKSVPAGTKLVLFGRYILNIYVGIVWYILRKTKLGAPKSTYRHNAQIGKNRTILTRAKKIRFWPSTHVIDEESFVKIARNSWQAEVIARSLRYQTLRTDKNSARYHSTTKLVKMWASMDAHGC